MADTSFFFFNKTPSLNSMESNYSSSPLNHLHPPSSYNEIFMQKSLIFADSLKDLRNIRSQLYSAAEFFEDAYHKSDVNQILLESLKDYVSKALISTIDHLGSVTSKVDTFLDENINEAYQTNLRVLSIQQRLQTCQTYSDHEGLSQQSLVIQIPKYHKKYLLPDGDFSEAVKSEKMKVESSGLRRGHTEGASSAFGSGLVDFTFTKAALNKGLEKRSRPISPSRFRIKRSGQSTSPSVPDLRSGSVIRRSISPNKQQHPLEAWRSQSLLYPERERERGRRKDIEVYSKKTKNLFKAFLSIHKYKNDNKPY